VFIPNLETNLFHIPTANYARVNIALTQCLIAYQLLNHHLLTTLLFLTQIQCPVAYQPLSHYFANNLS
jgi:hypothetical protein